jgi:hypothetical protein
MIVNREIEVLRFINEFGFCELFHVMQRFDLKKTRVYEILNGLVLAGLVKHQSVLNSRHRIYFLTSRGCKYTDLPPIGHIKAGQYQHNIVIINTYLRLREVYPNAVWISERCLKHEKFYDGLGKTGHISDGILLFSDDSRIAVEIELSTKGKSRIEKILKYYCTQLQIKEVWYFCSSPVMSAMREFSKKMPFVKLYNLDEFLHAKRSIE